MRCLCLWVIGLWCTSALSAPVLEKIIDGDTVVLVDDGQRIRLRLMDIDAPELAQAGGKQARRSLMQLCSQAEIAVTIHGQDRYQRPLGYLYCNGEEANAWQIAQGLAWFNGRYSNRLALQALEAEARAQGLGLWQAPQPMPPWQWRKRYSQHYHRQE